MVADRIIRSIPGGKLVLVMALASACVAPKSTPCGAGTYCPPQTECFADACLVSLGACGGFEDGTACVSPDGARAYCQAGECIRWRGCGDQITEDSEQCDQGDDNDDRLPGECRSDCRSAFCGDGILDSLDEQACLGAATILPVGFAPDVVLAVDLDGDGRDELATGTVNGAARTLAVFTRDSHGTLARRGFDLSASLAELASADLDGDGLVDLLARLESGYLVVVSHGLNSVRSSPLPGQPQTLAAGDVTADGRPDLVLVDGAAGNLVVLPNDGLGGFDASLSVPLGLASQERAVDLELADIDGDGSLDAAVVVTEIPGAARALVVDTRPGATAVVDAIPVEPPLRHVLVNDLDGDGFADVVVASLPSIQILWNRGLGSVAADSLESPTRIELAADASPYTVSAGDLNDDGRLDLLALAITSFDTGLIQLFNSGARSFIAQRKLATESLSFAATVSDVDRDGRLDAVVAAGFDQALAIHLGGDGPLGSMRRQPVESSPMEILAARLAAGGPTSLIVRVELAGGASSRLAVLRGLGGGRFAPAETTGHAPVSLAVADVDGDGADELAFVDGYGFREDPTVVVLDSDLMTELARIAAPQLQATLLPPIGLTDVTGDGRPDLVIGALHELHVWAGTGLAGAPFEATSRRSDLDGTDAVSTLVLSDVDEDGTIDAVVVRANYLLEFLLNDGQGYFAGATPTLRMGAGARVAIGDFDGDHRQDAVIADFKTGEATEPVGFLLNLTDGPAMTTIQAPGKPQSVAAVDLNDDGFLDVAVTLKGTDAVAVYLGLGDGTFPAEPQLFPAATSPRFLTVSDLTGDGRPDLAVTHEAEDAVGVFVGHPRPTPPELADETTGAAAGDEGGRRGEWEDEGEDEGED